MPEESTTQRGVRRRRRRHDVRRRAAVVVALLALLGAVGGAVWGLGQARVHHATAVVLVNPLDGNPFSPEGRGDDLVNLETEAQLVRSDTMGDLVARTVADDRSADVLLDDVAISVPPNTQLLEITATGDSDAAAEDSAQAFAEIYLGYRLDRTESALAEQAAQVKEQIGDNERERAVLLTRLSDLAASDARVPLIEQQVAAVTTQIGELRSQLADFQTSALDPGQVVTPAVGEPGGLPGGVVTSTLLGLLLGLGLAVVLMIALTRLDSVVRRPEDLAGPASSLLGVAPLDDRDEPSALAPLRAALLAVDRRRPLVVVTCSLTSDREAELERRQVGSGLAIALARATAASRLSTVVVEVAGAVDTRQRGLTDLIQGRARLDQVLVTPAPHLSLLSRGSDAARLDDLAAAPAMAAQIRELADRSDLVLLACGVPGDPRTQAIAAEADVLLLEVHEGESTLEEVEAATAELASLGARTVCTVFVPSPARVRTPWGWPARVRGRLAGATTAPLIRRAAFDRDG